MTWSSVSLFSRLKAKVSANKKSHDAIEYHCPIYWLLKSTHKFWECSATVVLRLSASMVLAVLVRSVAACASVSGLTRYVFFFSFLLAALCSHLRHRCNCIVIKHLFGSLFRVISFLSVSVTSKTASVTLPTSTLLTRLVNLRRWVLFLNQVGKYFRNQGVLTNLNLFIEHTWFKEEYFLTYEFHWNTPTMLLPSFSPSHM